MSENREPQNIEYKMLNIEGKENFIIRNSLFDIRYSITINISPAVSVESIRGFPDYSNDPSDHFPGNPYASD